MSVDGGDLTSKSCWRDLEGFKFTDSFILDVANHQVDEGTSLLAIGETTDCLVQTLAKACFGYEGIHEAESDLRHWLFQSRRFVQALSLATIQSANARRRLVSL